MRRAVTLTPALCLALLAGALAVFALPALPPQALLLPALAAAALAALRWPALRVPAAMLAAAAWTTWRVDLALSQRLPHALEGQDLVVVGRVVDLPQAREDALRLSFVVERVVDPPVAWSGGLVRLSWYDRDALPTCTRWQLSVRLKRPRALLNPDAADFERQALALGLVATGYVREAPEPAARGTVPLCIDALRQTLSQGVARALGERPAAHLLRALAVGDQGALTPEEWQVARATGIGHLIAISGLHVGLLAVLGVLAARLVWKCAPRLVLRWPAPLLEAPAGVGVATLYCALAGFGVATTRTLLMLALVAAATLLRRALAPAQGLALAAAAIVVADPCALLAPGFWLSFLGVAFLMLCLDRAARRWWLEVVVAQGAMSLGLLPLALWYFGQTSLVGPLANLVAVPFTSFVIVPLTLAGTLLLPLLPVVARPLLELAAWCADGQWWLLVRLADLPWAQWYAPAPGAAALLLGLVGAACLLLPRGVKGRALGLFLFLPLLAPRVELPPDGAFEAWVLDVGQGLSVLVRTRDHALLYDAGARYPSGFDLGAAAVAPALHALGTGRIDRLIVSHGDNDHAGGAAAVVQAMQPRETFSGEPARVRVPARPCRAGAEWRWNAVRFRLVHPPQPRDGNDGSCVLLVEGAQGRLLLPGDVSAAVEPAIAAAVGAGPPLALLVPHHGSRSSSSPDFIAAVHPALAVVSAGYRSRYGHPHPDVLARYAAAQVPVLNTAETGCVQLSFAADAAPRVARRCRASRPAPWREP